MLKVLDAATGFLDLEQSQKDQLVSIRSTYEREAAPLNDKWVKAIEEDESKTEDPMAAMYGWWGQNNDTPSAKARKERHDLDQKTEERITAILKDDQRARLPEKEPDDPMRW